MVVHCRLTKSQINTKTGFRPAGGDPLQTDGVTLWHQQRAGVEHEVLVAAGLDQGGEQGRLPGHGALSLGQVAQVVGEDGQVVGQVHAEFQADGLTASWDTEGAESGPAPTTRGRQLQYL